MEVRLLNGHDNRTAVSHIYEASWKHAYKGIIPQAYLDSIPEGRWCKAIDNPDWHTLVMLDDGKMIGTSSYCASRFDNMKGYGEIISIYLLPEYCGKGFGKQLLQEAMSGLKQMGYQDIFLWVLEENLSARRFYEKFGFAESGAYLEDNIGGKQLREMQYIYKIR